MPVFCSFKEHKEFCHIKSHRHKMLLYDWFLPLNYSTAKLMEEVLEGLLWCNWSVEYNYYVWDSLQCCRHLICEVLSLYLKFIQHDSCSNRFKTEAVNHDLLMRTPLLLSSLRRNILMRNQSGTNNSMAPIIQCQADMLKEREPSGISQIQTIRMLIIQIFAMYEEIQSLRHHLCCYK